MAKAVPTTTIPEQSGGAKLDGKGEYDYDLAVIGGGSGGLACAKMAAAHGARTVVFDYVKPSPRGSRWGLGGTCVNVGCVPKYLFHHAGLLSAAIHWDAPHVGWEGEFKEKVTWEKCVETVQNHVKSLNFSYRTGLRKAGVDYINALAKFVGPNELAYTYRGENKICKARYVLVAVGGRPHVDDSVPGATDLAITSDDIFSLKYPPNKTLCVGASYISLECAGFLKELGYDVRLRCSSPAEAAGATTASTAAHQTSTSSHTHCVHAFHWHYHHNHGHPPQQQLRLRSAQEQQTAGGSHRGERYIIDKSSD